MSATITLRPNATGATNWNGTYGTGTSRHGRLAVESDSEGIAHGSPGGYIYDTYYYDDMPGDAIAIVGNITGYMRVKKGTGNNGQFRLDAYDGTGYTNGTLRSPAQTVWTSYSEAYAPSSGSWDITKVNALVSRIYAWLHTDYKDSYCGWLKFDVTYEQAAGGFAHNVAQWLPPLLALASHGLLKREAAAILSAEKVRPSNREDLGRLLEAFRCRPTFVI